MSAERGLFCANIDCLNPIAEDEWRDAGTWNGYLLCPECFREFDAEAIDKGEGAA